MKTNSMFSRLASVWIRCTSRPGATRALVLAAAVLILCAATARAAIEFHFEVGTVHSVGDCDGALNDSDPYFIYRVGSSGTTDYRTNDCGGCGGDAAFNQWWTHTVTAAVDKIRARVRDNDDDYDPWGYCTGDCDSDLGGADLTLYDDNAWYSQWTSTGYADGYGGDGDNDCPDTVQIDYRDYYCDNSAPGAPSSLSVTQSGNIYGSLSSTSATWERPAMRIPEFTVMNTASAHRPAHVM